MPEKAKEYNNLHTLQLSYLETCGVRKWGMAKGEGRKWYEDSSCFMAGDISEQYHSQIYRPLQLYEPA
jgi:hypothetical protein